MIDLKIKITGLSVYDEETPLEFSLDEAHRLWEELGKVFGGLKIKRNNYKINIDPENMISIDEVDL